MISLERLAISAYRAHGQELWRRIGVSQRPWASLPPSERACWIEAVRAIREDIAAIQ